MYIRGGGGGGGWGGCTLSVPVGVIVRVQECRRECGTEYECQFGSSNINMDHHDCKITQEISNWTRLAVLVQELKKLVVVALCSSKVSISLTWVKCREQSHTEIAKLIIWVSSEPGQASTLLS